VLGTRSARVAPMVGAIVTSALLSACGGGDGGATGTAASQAAGSTAPAASGAPSGGGSGGSAPAGDTCSFLTSREVGRALDVKRAPVGHRTGPDPAATCRYHVGTRFLDVETLRPLDAKSAAGTRTAVLQDPAQGARTFSVSGFTVLVKPNGQQRPGVWQVTIALVNGTGIRGLTLFDRSTTRKPLTNVLMKAAVPLAKAAARRE
jgi:hypothetical protein